MHIASKNEYIYIRDFNKTKCMYFLIKYEFFLRDNEIKERSQQYYKRKFNRVLMHNKKISKS